MLGPGNSVDELVLAAMEDEVVVGIAGSDITVDTDEAGFWIYHFFVSE